MDMPKLRKEGSDDEDPDEEESVFVVEFHNHKDKFRAEEIAAKRRPIHVSASPMLALTKEEYKEMVRLGISHKLHGPPPEPEALPIRFRTAEDELDGYILMREYGNVSQTSTGVVFATKKQMGELDKYGIDYERLQLAQPAKRGHAGKSRSKQTR